jgi:hypothetical protein
MKPQAPTTRQAASINAFNQNESLSFDDVGICSILDTTWGGGSSI